MTALAWPCVNSPLLPTVKPEIVNRLKDSREVNMTLPENAPPTIDPNVSMKNWEDGVCHLLIYAGDFPQDVLKTNSHNPEAANIQHEADGIYTGRTATQTIRWLDTWDDARAWEFRNARGNTNVSQNSRMETNREYVSAVDTDTDSDAELDHKAKKCALQTWKCRCALAGVTEKYEHEEWINRNVHSPWICANHQHGWEYSDRQIYDSMDFAKWCPITTDCLQPEEGSCAPADVPPADVPPADVTPELIRIPKSDMTRIEMNIDDNLEKCEHEEWINRNVHSPWICANHQHGWGNSDMQIYDSMDIAEWYTITTATDCLQPEDGNCAPANFPPADVPAGIGSEANIGHDAKQHG